MSHHGLLGKMNVLSYPLLSSHLIRHPFFRFPQSRWAAWHNVSLCFWRPLLHAFWVSVWQENRRSGSDGLCWLRTSCQWHFVSTNGPNNECCECYYPALDLVAQQAARLLFISQLGSLLEKHLFVWMHLKQFEEDWLNRLLVKQQWTMVCYCLWKVEKRVIALMLSFYRYACDSLGLWSVNVLLCSDKENKLKL